MLEEYPTNVGKYMVRKEHVPYNDNAVNDDDDTHHDDEQLTSTEVLNEILMKKMLNKKSLETLPYQASNRQAYDQLSKVKMYS